MLRKIKLLTNLIILEKIEREDEMRGIIYVLCLFFAFSLYSSGFTLDDVVKALERNSSHLKDMSCEIVVETDLGNEVKVQRMRLWSKG
ncbi:hypothetical protein DRQ18_06145 [bacterium]|nr:MAG: hypothetical protein DRQ18_06145 [bacterium]